MRVLMVFSRLEVGGAEKIALDLIPTLKRREVETFVAGVYGGGSMRDAFAAEALAVHDGLAANRLDVRGVWRVRRLIRRHRIDAVLVVDAVRNAMLCGLLGAAFSGRPVARVLWCHACPGHGRRGGRMQGFAGRLRRLAGLIDVIVPVARWQRDALARCGVPRTRMCVIENGIALDRCRSDIAPADARARLNLPRDAFLLLQVANYWPEKDPTWLLEAMARVRSTHPRVHLVMVGRGMDAGRFQGTVESLGLRGAVTLAGARRDVNVFLRAADAFVLASAHETLSIATLEAMACGLPVIVSDIPGFRDLVVDSVSGLKCPPLDSAALADRIRRLADDEALALRLSQGARARAERYDVDRMAARFARLLRAAARAAGGR